MERPILLVPNQTGAGHNMRALAIAQEIKQLSPTQPVAVLLGSLQSTFKPLFENEGVSVISTEDANVDHSKSAHLTWNLDKHSYIDQYLVPTFFNGSRVLEYLAYFREIDPVLVVSDYNLSASVGAIIGGYRHILVTERYDFSVVQLSDEDFRSAGFDVNVREMKSMRLVLTRVFEWILSNSELVLTDKPAVHQLDEDSALYRRFNCANVKFVGPMTRRTDEEGCPSDVIKDFAFSSDPLIVASVGGTTMFLEDKIKAIEVYRDAFSLLRNYNPRVQMILIGRSEGISGVEGVTVVDYVPNWIPLLKRACMLISQPGWITVTEAAALGVPATFVLPGLGEYHEIEASRRLRILGFPSLIDPTPEELCMYMRSGVEGRLAESCRAGFAALAPDGRGTETAVRLILEAL